MAKRINLGGAYETENQDGETITRHRYFVEVPSALMSELATRSAETGLGIQDLLAGAIDGRFDLDTGEIDTESFE